MKVHKKPTKGMRWKDKKTTNKRIVQPLQIKLSVFCTVEEAAQGRFCPSKAWTGQAPVVRTWEESGLEVKINELNAIYLGRISVV